MIVCPEHSHAFRHLLWSFGQQERIERSELDSRGKVKGVDLTVCSAATKARPVLVSGCQGSKQNAAVLQRASEACRFTGRGAVCFATSERNHKDDFESDHFQAETLSAAALNARSKLLLWMVLGVKFLS